MSSSTATSLMPTGTEAFVQSIALELTIFSATLVVALVLKVCNFKPGCAPSFLEHLCPPRQKAPVAKWATEKIVSPRSAASAPLPPATQAGGGRKPATRTSAQGPANILDTIWHRASNKNAEEALALYQELWSSDLQVKVLLCSTRHSGQEFYSALIQSAVRADWLEMVEKLLDDMTSIHIERTLSFYESVMKVLAGKKHYRSALAVYKRLHSEGLKVSPVTLSCLINFAAELGELDSAIGFFEQLAATSTPSIRAYMMVLRVLSKRQDWKKSLEIFRDMQTRDVAIDSLILNSVLATGVASGKTEATAAFLHEIAETTTDIVDTISYNTVLKGFAHQKVATKALKLLDCMLKRGTKPNCITFNTVMDAAVRGNQSEDAWQALEWMRESGLRPDKYTCTILLKGLHEDSPPKQISTMVDMIQSALPYCDAALRTSLFRSIMEVIAKLNNASLLVRAFNQMTGNGAVPTNADCQLVLQTLAQQCNTELCSTMWRRVFATARPDGVVQIFTAVMDDLAKREKVEGMMCALASLSAVAMEGEADAPGSQKSLGKNKPDLVQQCRAALFQAASRRQNSSPAFKRLLELAPEQGVQLDTLLK